MPAAPVLAPEAPPAPAPPGRRQVRYLHGPVADVALALAWVPFALAVHVLQGGSPYALALVISGVFLLSFAHQPLTVALVYGDRERFELRRALFTWAPPLLLVAVVAGYTVSFTLLAVVGGLWNAQHTLMQRYGITRIYGRKVGQVDGRSERLLLWSWLVVAVVAIAADPATPGRVAGVRLGRNNDEALQILARLGPLASGLVRPAVAAAAVVAVAWAVREYRRPVVNPAKWCYLGATAALFGVMPVDPLAGLMGYVGAHAVEYVVIVHQSLGRQYGTEGGPAGLGRVVRGRRGPLRFLAAYGAVILAVLAGLAWLGSAVAHVVVVFTLGGLHILYDGVIWRLRRPAVARTLAVPSLSPSTPGSAPQPALAP